jgi:hypothetical protein
MPQSALRVVTVICFRKTGINGKRPSITQKITRSTYLKSARPLQMFPIGFRYRKTPRPKAAYKEPAVRASYLFQYAPQSNESLIS